MIPPLKLIFVSVPKFYPQIAQNLPFIFSENMPQFKTIVAPKVATTVSTINAMFFKIDESLKFWRYFYGNSLSRTFKFVQSVHTV